MKNQKRLSIIHILTVTALLISLLFTSQAPVQAGTTALLLTPNTWNVIGLDSNNVNVGPNLFPVGVNVCVVGDMPAYITADFVWDSTNSYIKLSSNNTNPLTIYPPFDTDGCVDVFFEVEIKRVTAAYFTSRRFHIDVKAYDSGDTLLTSASTPTPRELYVEKLVSQSRNSTITVSTSTNGTTYTTAPVPLVLEPDATYYIKLDGLTATGYNEIETFLSLPNTMFQVLDVTTTYTTVTSPAASPSDAVWGDACTWDSNPLSLNYRTCATDGKLGGVVSVVYKVYVLPTASGTLTVEPVIYDFSGSSYHYNADFGKLPVVIGILNPEISKAFSPIVVGIPGTATLTLTVVNPYNQVIDGVSVSDTFPTGMVVAATPNGSTTCTGGTLTAPAGASTISVSSFTLAALATCTIKVDVTVSAAGVYPNTADLYVGDELTGQASATLTAAAASACAAETSTLAWWQVPSTATEPPDTTGGLPTPPIGTYVDTAAAIALLDTNDTKLITTLSGTYVWELKAKFGATSYYTGKYYQFSVDTTNYEDINWSFNLGRNAQGPQSFRIAYTPAGGTETQLAILDFTEEPTSGRTPDKLYGFSFSFTGTLPAGVTVFRIYPYNAENNGLDTLSYLDEIKFVGRLCPPPPPTIAKVFTPDTLPDTDRVTTLTFTIANPGSTTPNIPPENLTGINFSDTLPAGLIIADPNGLSTTCTGTVTAVAGTDFIELVGASIVKLGSCTISVNVTTTDASINGTFVNVSGVISSTQSGPNLTSTGYATDTLTVIAPPLIEKAFNPQTILTGETSTLSFTITNPNLTTTLTGIEFTDTLPTGITVKSSEEVVETCSGEVTRTASTITLSDSTLAAGASCTITVAVIGTSDGLDTYTNTVTATSENGGSSEPSTAYLVVKKPAPALALLKQVGLTASGPWTTFLAGAPVSETIYYRFTVENTGEVPVSGIKIVDDLIGIETDDFVTCLTPMTDPLPAADIDDNDHITTCVASYTVPAAGTVMNTAVATGLYNAAAVTSNTDDAWYSTPMNYGHLPYSGYPGMNLLRDGGARHLTDGSVARLGATVPVELDGSSSDTYAPEGTDDALFFTGTWESQGSFIIQVYCAAQPCYLHGWMDWNEDGDFEDTNEHIITATITTSGTSQATYTFPFGDDTTTPLNGTFYTRLRLYAADPITATPDGIATTTGDTETVGEVEDYMFVFDGGTPTAITETYGPTSTVDSDAPAIHIYWETLNETDILGFTLYRATAGAAWETLAYVNAKDIGSLRGNEYEYIDTDVESRVFYFYWLKVDLKDNPDVILGPTVEILGGYYLMLPLVQR